MTIDLAKVKFTNDFFSTSLPDGSVLVINKVDEDFITGDNECIVKALTIEVQQDEDTIISCPCVIGLSNDLLEIKTAYTEYEGEVLTPENMLYCTIEVYEN